METNNNERDEMPRNNYSNEVEDSEVEKSYAYWDKREHPESKHTKTPWAQRDLEIIGPYGTNKHICEMTGNFMDEEEKKANAAYIVKACNAHEELVKALEECYIVLESMAKFPENDVKGLWDNQKCKARYEKVNKALYTVTGNDIYK